MLWWTEREEVKHGDDMAGRMTDYCHAHKSATTHDILSHKDAFHVRTCEKTAGFVIHATGVYSVCKSSVHAPVSAGAARLPASPKLSLRLCPGVSPSSSACSLPSLSPHQQCGASQAPWLQQAQPGGTQNRVACSTGDGNACGIDAE